ncbi:hypothetical protein EVA_19956 [gut metagenome]|uniref:Uncharacterized protein n=1 Tax=gut metagenome TaxID=749906 RepID=J9FQT4_9ZZZZ
MTCSSCPRLVYAYCAACQASLCVLGSRLPVGLQPSVAQA